MMLSLLIRELGWLFWLTTVLGLTTAMTFVLFMAALTAWLLASAKRHRVETRILELVELEEDPARALQAAAAIRLLAVASGDVETHQSSQPQSAGRNTEEGPARSERVSTPKRESKRRIWRGLWKLILFGFAALGAASLLLC